MHQHSFTSLTSLTSQWLSLATDADIREGLHWYARAHELCRELAEQSQLPLEVVVAIVACLSPRNRWDSNMLEARALVLNEELARWRSLPRQLARARELLEAARAGADYRAHLEVALRGPKVSAFYDNILLPDCSIRVTLDTHMVQAFNLPEPLNEKRYPVVENSLRAAFLEVAPNWLPHQTQATIWTVRRRTGLSASDILSAITA